MTDLASSKKPITCAKMEHIRPSGHFVTYNSEHFNTAEDASDDHLLTLLGNLQPFQLLFPPIVARPPFIIWYSGDKRTHAAAGSFRACIMNRLKRLEFALGPQLHKQCTASSGPTPARFENAFQCAAYVVRLSTWTVSLLLDLDNIPFQPLSPASHSYCTLLRHGMPASAPWQFSALSAPSALGNIVVRKVPLV